MERTHQAVSDALTKVQKPPAAQIDGPELGEYELPEALLNGPLGALQLQRTMGNRAVARILSSPVRHAGAPEALQRLIQRRIGFEVETGIPITKRTQKPGHSPRYNDIHPSTVGTALPVTKGKLSPDHIPGKPAHKASRYERFNEWPIIELVTDPVEDDLKMDAFEAIAKQWITELKAIKVTAQTSPPAKQYSGEYYVGLPSAQGYDDGNAGWERIAPQATVGVPLDQVAKVLAAFDPTKGFYRDQLATQIGQKAGSDAAKIMQDIFETYNPGSDGAGVEGVKGLLTMMVNHLKCGGEPEITKQTYIKNRPANVMFKTKLSTVRNNVAATTFGAKVLGSPGGRLLVRQKLLASTGRGAADPVFIAGTNTAPSDVTVGTWIDEILDGTDDKLFDEMKNEWAAELTPDATNEVVIELRKLGSFVSHDNYKLEDDAGLLAFLKKVYGANQLYKQRQL